MGYAIKDETIVSGIKEFRKSKLDEIGLIYARLNNWLNTALETFGNIEGLYYEKVINHGGARGNQSRTAQRYGGYEAIITMWCYTNKIPCHPIMWNTLKKSATGNGRASKQEVIDAVRAMGFDPVNHDEADALALLDFAIKKTGTLI